MTALDDPHRLGEQVHAREIRLDWSRVAQAPRETLLAIFTTVDGVADTAALNLETVAPTLRPILQRALEFAAEDRALRLAALPPTDVIPATESTEPDDATTKLTELTPRQVRDELVRLALLDLQGPTSENEVLSGDSPDERYLVGALAPRNPAQSGVEDEELAGATAAPRGADDDAQPDPGSGISGGSASNGRSLRQKSIGLTFGVDERADSLRVRAKWGVYQRISAEDAKGALPDDASKRVWQRHPCDSGWIVIPLKPGHQQTQLFGPEDEGGVWLKSRVRFGKRDGRWMVTLFLVNDRIEPRSNKATAWLFQASLEVSGAADAPIFLARPVKTIENAPGMSLEEATLEMLYRTRREFAVGHGTAVEAEASEAEPDRAWRLCTVASPAYEVSAVAAPGLTDVPEFHNLALDMRELAKLSQGDVAAALRPLTAGYGTWIARRRTELAADRDLAAHRLEAEAALAHCETALRRIDEGIELLAGDPNAVKAFGFMQSAMADQRVHSELAKERRSNPAVTLAEVDIPKNRSWRPFQLAFVLLNLPGLTRLDHPDRSTEESAVADLLWFPTGGGKTEAYLGLTAYTLAIRRLQGEVNGRSGAYGIAVLMRYTLRLLTLQQFQRAAALICSCERLREQDEVIWGREPFRLGLWVGRAATPNTTDQAEEAIQRGQASGSGSPAQLTNCPWCGAPIDDRRNVRVEPIPRRTLIHCSDPERSCPFGYRERPREGLPVVVVDEEIYRLLPSLLIATVDKFARMPWKGEARNLFGGVDQRCERHGFWAPDLDDTRSHRAAGNWPPAKSLAVAPARPLDLIIQDELHLISGPLGSMVGLYETAIDALATWDVDGHSVRPKVIASTATIRRAAEQVRALFLRRVEVFPPTGLSVDDSFFALEQKPGEKDGRLYLGICVPGMRHKAVLIRVYVAFMAAAQKLLIEHGAAAADPYMTLLGYFSSIRELGSMIRVVEDDLLQRLQHTDERGLESRSIYAWRELTSRLSSTEIPKTLDALEQPFRDNHIPKTRRPLDVVLATNMISVGVDVPRLGLMVVTGQPKVTAEYIQATSRVGRNKPGLVVTVFHGNRPRDISHYERFHHDHATFYRQVEPLSVTPFSAGAVERGLAGVLVSLVRHGGDELGPNRAAGKVRRETLALKRARQLIANRASEVMGDKALEEYVGERLDQKIDAWVARAELQRGYVLGYQDARDGETVGLLQSPGLERWDVFTAPHSLRNVEPGVNLILNANSLGRKRGEA